MKVLRLHKPLDLRFHDEPVPDVGPDEVLVKVASVGVCASDVHYYREGRIGDQVVEKPIVLGHEFSGTVAEVGEHVKTLVEGARVAVEPSKACKECEMCREGYANICPNVQFFGTPPIDGSLREYLAWPAELCIQVSEDVSFDEAAMIEPLAVGVYAVDLAEMAGRESVAILGVGAIGLSVLQAARIVGAGKIIVSDPIAERRELAMKLGADVAIDPNTTDLASDVMRETGLGVEVVFECAGTPDAVWQTAQIVRPKGRVVVVGIPEEDQYCFGASKCRRKELNVQFVRRSRNTAERSVEMVERELVDVASYATHAFPFDRVEEALRLAMDKTDGVVRAVIRVSDG
jgi:L-iditol 2-dehydrogenase